MASVLPPEGAVGPPIIMVSNRLPFDINNRNTNDLRINQSSGSRWATLVPLVWRRNGIWVGWPGNFKNDRCLNDDFISFNQHRHKVNSCLRLLAGDGAGANTSFRYLRESEREDRDGDGTRVLLDIHFVAVELRQSAYESYNSGCCYCMMWPLFHSFPARAKYDIFDWSMYRYVNGEFARCTLLALRGMRRKLDEENQAHVAPLVWINDYKLLTAATVIRQAVLKDNIRCKLGLFLYTPFPSWNILILCPWADNILEGMLSCDVVCFNNDVFCMNFLDSCRQCGYQVDHHNKTIQLAGRSVQVKALSVGINYNHFRQLSVSSPPVDCVQGNVVFILAIDRLDYSRGIAFRISAFERLLEKHREHVTSVTLIQIAVPSLSHLGEFQDMVDETGQGVKYINSQFSKVNWQPVRFSYGYMSQAQIASLFRDAAVAMVTPLRDGVSLVAKKFVACQTGETPGVLVLSQFAGSETAMSGAIVVNPYDIEKTADALHRALTMPLEEKKQRMMMLSQQESSQNIFTWTNSFLSTLETFPYHGVGIQNEQQIQVPPYLENFDSYLTNCIHDGCKLVVILEYYTLVPHANHDQPLEIVSDEVRELLKSLASMHDVDIVLVDSKRVRLMHAEINIEGITYAGVNGQEILHTDRTEFIHPVPNNVALKYRDLTRALQVNACRMGAWVEETTRGSMLIYHYRDAPARIQNTILSRAIEMVYQAGYNYIVYDGMMEAWAPQHSDMDATCDYILRTMHGMEWSRQVRVVYVGGDCRCVMPRLHRSAFNLFVDPTESDSSLAERDNVIAMLKWAEHKMSRRTTRGTTRIPDVQILNRQLERPNYVQVSMEEED